MKLLIDPEEKEAYKSLTDDHPARIPDFTVGDVIPFFVSLAPRIFQQWDSNIFAPIDVSDWEIRVAIGNAFAVPTSGDFPITYASVTAETRVSFDPTAGELEEIINSISTIVSAGYVDVVGTEGHFAITFRVNGARTAFSADASDLIPVSLIEIDDLVLGTVSERAVQSLRIRQDAGVIAELNDDSDAPAIAVELVVQGDSTHNHKVRLQFPPDRWNGSWTFAAAGVTSVSINYAPSQEQIEAAIEAMVSIGNGNVSVVQEDENNFLVMFKNGRGNQAIADILADGTTLKVIGTKSGDLDLTADRMQFLIPEGENSTVTILEVEATPSGGLPEKILRRDVILNGPVI